MCAASLQPRRCLFFSLLYFLSSCLLYSSALAASRYLHLPSFVGRDAKICCVQHGSLTLANVGPSRNEAWSRLSIISCYINSLIGRTGTDGSQFAWRMLDVGGTTHPPPVRRAWHRLKPSSVLGGAILTKPGLLYLTSSPDLWNAERATHLRLPASCRRAAASALSA